MIAKRRPYIFCELGNRAVISIDSLGVLAGEVDTALRSASLEYDGCALG